MDLLADWDSIKSVLGPLLDLIFINDLKIQDFFHFSQ